MYNGSRWLGVKSIGAQTPNYHTGKVAKQTTKQNKVKQNTNKKRGGK